MYRKMLMASKKFVKQFFKVIYLHSVHPPSPSPPHPPPLVSAAALSRLPNFQQRGPTGSQFLEGGFQKGNGDFFQQGGGVAVFT